MWILARVADSRSKWTASEFLAAANRLMQVLGHLELRFQDMTLLSRDEWINFRYKVKNTCRFIFSSSVLNDEIDASSKYLSTEQFLQELLSLSSKRFFDLAEGTAIWRAQLDGTPYRPEANVWIAEEGSEDKLEGFTHKAFLKPHDGKRMTPFPDRAREGRVNPKGIPCLYGATNPNTALAEMKPRAGSFLTLSEFVTTKNLRIVDFARDLIELANPYDPTDEEMDSMIWEDLNDAFSEPVSESDDIADYAPTQIVAELFRRSGFDGIKYKSKIVEFESLEPVGSPERAKDYSEARKTETRDDLGKNIALFNPKSAEFQRSDLYKFTIDATAKFSFRRVNQMVFCSDQKPEMR